jgi:hypothetical protein
MNEDHDKLQQQFQDELRNLEKQYSDITKAQFEKLYTQRAQAICDDILGGFQKVRQNYLNNNPGDEHVINSAISEWYATLEPEPGAKIGYDPKQSVYREYMSRLSPEIFRLVVDQYKAGLGKP